MYFPLRPPPWLFRGLRAPGRLPDRRSGPEPVSPVSLVSAPDAFSSLFRGPTVLLRPSGAGKWLSGVPGAAQGHPERRFCPCRRRGLFLGLPAAAGFPRSAPPFGSQRPEGPFSAPRRIPRGAGGLKARTGASWGRPGASWSGPGPLLPLPQPRSACGFSAAFPRVGPPLRSPEARRAVLSPGAVLEALEAVLRLESPHRGVLGPPGAVSGPFSSPPPPGSLS